MTTKASKNLTPVIAGILFGVSAIWELYSFVNLYKTGSGFSFENLFWALAFTATAIVLIAKVRANYAIAPFAIVALLELISFIKNLVQYFESFSVYSINIFSILSKFVCAIAWIVLCGIAVANFASKSQKLKGKINRLWLVPAALFAVSNLYILYNRIYGIIYSFYWKITLILLFGILVSILTIIAFALSALWIVYPDGLPKKEQKKTEINTETNNTTTATTATTTTTTVVVAYCDLVKHVLLLLFTCGIWNYIWIYRMTGYTNSAKGEEYRDPTKKLLLCMFVPFYNIYWTYKTAQRVDKMAAEKGIPSDMTTLCLILSIFVAIIPPILLQSVMNKIVTANNTQPVTEQKVAVPEKAETDTTEELKKFKELLDSGVITQEEFDAKKKQLLGV